MAGAPSNCRQIAAANQHSAQKGTLSLIVYNFVNTGWIDLIFFSWKAECLSFLVMYRNLHKKVLFGCKNTRHDLCYSDRPDCCRAPRNN